MLTRVVKVERSRPNVSALEIWTRGYDLRQDAEDALGSMGCYLYPLRGHATKG